MCSVGTFRTRIYLPYKDPASDFHVLLIFSRTKRRKLIAVEDFLTKDNWAVSLVREEVVKEIEADKDGWTKVKKRDGSRGLVQSAFLKGKSSLNQSS